MGSCGSGGVPLRRVVRDVLGTSSATYTSLPNTPHEAGGALVLIRKAVELCAW